MSAPRQSFCTKVSNAFWWVTDGMFTAGPLTTVLPIFLKGHMSTSAVNIATYLPFGLGVLLGGHYSRGVGVSIAAEESAPQIERHNKIKEHLTTVETFHPRNGYTILTNKINTLQIEVPKMLRRLGETEKALGLGNNLDQDRQTADEICSFPALNEVIEKKENKNSTENSQKLIKISTASKLLLALNAGFGTAFFVYGLVEQWCTWNKSDKSVWYPVDEDCEHPDLTSTFRIIQLSASLALWVTWTIIVFKRINKTYEAINQLKNEMDVSCKKAEAFDAEYYSLFNQIRLFNEIASALNNIDTRIMKGKKNFLKKFTVSDFPMSVERRKNLEETSFSEIKKSYVDKREDKISDIIQRTINDGVRTVKGQLTEPSPSEKKRFFSPQKSMKVHPTSDIVIDVDGTQTRTRTYARTPPSQRVRFFTPSAKQQNIYRQSICARLILSLAIASNYGIVPYTIFDFSNHRGYFDELPREPVDMLYLIGTTFILLASYIVYRLGTMHFRKMTADDHNRSEQESRLAHLENLLSGPTFQQWLEISDEVLQLQGTLYTATTIINKIRDNFNEVKLSDDARRKLGITDEDYQLLQKEDGSSSLLDDDSHFQDLDNSNSMFSLPNAASLSSPPPGMELKDIKMDVLGEHKNEPDYEYRPLAESEADPLSVGRHRSVLFPSSSMRSLVTSPPKVPKQVRFARRDSDSE